MGRPSVDIRTYLETVSGGSVAPLKPLLGAEERLPLVLRARYRLESTHLFDHELVLAVERDGIEAATPAAYKAHVAAVASLGRGPAALVLTGITSALRARLVSARVPFIVPGTQLFLPMLLVDLRERMTRPAVPREGALSSVAQLVVLTHLQGQRLDEMSLAGAASLLGYSPMTLTKAKDELVAAGLCSTRPLGRALRLVFACEGRALWERALPRLSSPVVRTDLVRRRASEVASGMPEGFVRAGLSALSDLTNVADDAVTTVAASKAAAAAAALVRVDLNDDATDRVEVWRYDPGLLAAEGRADALSLYLSLRDVADERVQGALDDLLETLPW